MSAYGDMLGFFSELNERFDLYSRIKKTDGAFAFLPAGTAVGVRQDAGARSDLVNGIVVRTHHVVLWLTSKPVVTGLLAVMWNGAWYVAEPEETWTVEAGFYRIEVHRIVGTTARTQSVTPYKGTFS